MQALILYSLSTSPLVAKGGTYLWFFHGLNRFSEDLDFTAEGKVKADMAQDVSRTLDLFGVRNRASVMKDDRYTLSIRMGSQAPLYSNERDTCYVNIEVSRREKVLREENPLKLDEPSYGMPMVYLKGMSLEEVLSEKVRAVMVRSKARDLYDLWYLLTRKMVKPSMDLIDRKLSFYGKSFDRAKFQAGVERIGRYWIQELRPIIIGILPKFEDVKDIVLNSFRH